MSFASTFILILMVVYYIKAQIKNSNPSQHFRAFLNCNMTVKLNSDYLADEDKYCKPNFDGISCWNAALANTIANVSCPNYIIGSDTKKNATRKCLSNSMWQINNETGKHEINYSECNFNDRVEALDENQLMALLDIMKSLDRSPYSDDHTAQAFDTCIDSVLVQPKTHLQGLYCSRTFDGWGCWNDTPAAHSAHIQCPHFIPGFSNDKMAYKVCTERGTWYRHYENNKTWSNYTTCVDIEDFEFRQKIISVYISGYSISVIALVVSLAIFFSFKIIWYCTIVNKYEVLDRNHFDCQALHILVQYFMVCNYFWMFCEGLYLHTLLVIAFVSENKILKWFYMLGWTAPIPLTVTYALLRHNSQDPKDTQFCWIYESSYTLFLSVPVCISLLLNLFFLINIVRVLVTKLRAVNSPDTHQTKKAVRATLILIPLLGLHYVLTPFRPEPKSTAEVIYEIISAFVTSLQGLCVATLFCFFNGEVLSHIKKRWNQFVVSSGYKTDRRMSYANTNVSSIPSKLYSIWKQVYNIYIT